MKMRSPRGAWTFDEPYTEQEVELCGEFIQLKLRSRAAAPETHLLPAARPGYSIESTLPLDYEEEADAYALKPTKGVAKATPTRDAQPKKPSTSKPKAPPKDKGDKPIQCSSKESALMANMAAAEGISKEKALQKIRTLARNVPTAPAKTSSTSGALSAPPAPKAPMLRVDTGDEIELINMDDYVAVEDYENLRDEFEEQNRRIALLDKEVRV